MKRIFLVLCSLLGITLAGADSFDWSLTGEGILLRLAPGTYVYADGLRLQAEDASGKAVTLQGPAVSSHDGLAVYDAPSLLWRSDRAAVRGTVTFQGCENDLCLLPRTLRLAAPEERIPAKKEPLVPEGFTVRVKEGFMNAPEFLAFLQGKSVSSAVPGWGFWLSALLILLGGIGLNLTPCVLPMIPVNLAIIGAAGGRRGFCRALLYGAGMTLAYGTLGLLVLFAGMRFGELNSHWLFNGAVALLFLLLGLSQFGLFSLDFSAAQNRIRFSDSREGPWWIVLLLGSVSALLAGACVAPVVMGTLLYAADLCAAGKGYGALLPFVLGLGMALPWPLAGYGWKVLPKPGAYMVRIKQGFGVLILLLGIYYGVLGIGQFRNRGSVPPGRVDLGRILTDARREKRTVLLEFTASWCKNCAAMQKSTLQDAAVRAALQKVTPVPVPAEDLHDPETERRLSAFGIRGLPAFVLLTPEER